MNHCFRLLRSQQSSFLMPQVCTTDDRGGTSRMGCERFWPAQSRNVSLQVRNLDEARHGNVRIRSDANYLTMIDSMVQNVCAMSEGLQKARLASAVAQVVDLEAGGR
jgi:hypothetical protein